MSRVHRSAYSHFTFDAPTALCSENSQLRHYTCRIQNLVVVMKRVVGRRYSETARLQYRRETTILYVEEALWTRRL